MAVSDIDSLFECVYTIIATNRPRKKKCHPLKSAICMWQMCIIGGVILFTVWSYINADNKSKLESKWMKEWNSDRVNELVSELVRVRHQHRVISIPIINIKHIIQELIRHGWADNHSTICLAKTLGITKLLFYGTYYIYSTYFSTFTKRTTSELQEEMRSDVKLLTSESWGSWGQDKKSWRGTRV